MKKIFIFALCLILLSCSQNIDDMGEDMFFYKERILVDTGIYVDTDKEIMLNEEETFFKTLSPVVLRIPTKEYSIGMGNKLKIFENEHFIYVGSGQIFKMCMKEKIIDNNHIIKSLLYQSKSLKEKYSLESNLVKNGTYFICSEGELDLENFLNSGMGVDKCLDENGGIEVSKYSSESFKKSYGIEVDTSDTNIKLFLKSGILEYLKIINP